MRRSYSLCLWLAVVVGTVSAGLSAAAETDFQTDLQALAALGSRVTGYPGCSQAADYIEQRFREIGLEIDRQQFAITVPLEKECRLEVPAFGAVRFGAGQFHGLIPNLVCPSSTPPEGLAGSLIYGGYGTYRELDGKDVAGSIALLEFNCGYNWLNPFALGAQAVIFIEPERATRSECEQKFVTVPALLPRFWASRELGERLKLLAETPSTNHTVTIRSRWEWKEVVAENVLGFLPGADRRLASESIVVQAYYDSASPVPAVAPGAQQAGGMAALLGLARECARERPRRSVLFAATPGHFQALAGMRAFAGMWGRRGRYPREENANRRASQEEAERNLRQADGLLRTTGSAPVSPDPVTAAGQARAREAVAAHGKDAQARLRLLKKYESVQFPLMVSLDLSGGSSRLGLFCSGAMFDDVHLTRFFSPVGRAFQRYAKDYSAFHHISPDGIFADATNPTKGWMPADYLGLPVAFDGEIAMRAGRPALTLATAEDDRALFFSPHDTLERANMEHLVGQASLAIYCVRRLLDEPDLYREALARVERLYLTDFLRERPVWALAPACKVLGQVLEFDPRVSFVPSKPVPGALAVVLGPAKSMGGVAGMVVGTADQDGVFRLRGNWGDVAASVDAFAIDPGTGALAYATDMSTQASGRDGKFPRGVAWRDRTARPLVATRVQSLTLSDLIDPRTGAALPEVRMYQAGGVLPRSYAVFQPFRPLSGPCSEPALAVVCAPPGARLWIVAGRAVARPVLALLNASESHPLGTGFPLGGQPRLHLALRQSASDMWELDEWRMSRLARSGVENDRLLAIHKEAGTALLDTERWLAEARYGEAVQAARRAAALESWAYPDLLGTTNDVVLAALFYLALLAPLALFLERLLFACSKLPARIAATLGFFAVLYLLLNQVHPAFSLALTPAVALVAVVMLVLGLLVGAAVWARFVSQVQESSLAATRLPVRRVGRLAGLGVAFSLGLAHMRRRPFRTSLAASTLVLVSFVALSLTSVRPVVAPRSWPVHGKGSGLLVRDRVWVPLAPDIGAHLAGACGLSEGEGTELAWLVSRDPGRTLHLRVTSQGGKEWEASAILGLSAQDGAVTGAPSVLTAGEWRGSEQDACALPFSALSALGILPSEVGRARVNILGRPVLVRAAFNETKLEAVRDLDGEPPTPIYYPGIRPDEERTLKEAAQRGDSALLPFAVHYEHLPASQIVIVPSRLALEWGGIIRAVSWPAQRSPEESASIASLGTDLSVYAATASGSALFTALGSMRLSGFAGTVVPLAIAVLVVLNTMLGAVYERTREIGIMSAVGLAPRQIGVIFLAEACVYATLGVGLGYLLGQGFARAAVAQGWSAGLTLNYSSLSAVAAAAIVAVAALGSTIYPGLKASRLAVPDLERRWRLPEHVELEGTEALEVSLPFTLSLVEAQAAAGFLAEFFSAYLGSSTADFCVEALSRSTLGPPDSPSYFLEFRAWLAPYDLGVSQLVRIWVAAAPREEFASVRMQMLRAGGDLSSWRRANWFFLDAVRKQFLIFRTLSAQEREQYVAPLQAWGQ